MRAGVMTEPGNIIVMEKDVPDFGADEVLIKVKYCGICGTDSHIFNGVYSKDKLPLIPGHEFVGTIAAKGQNVKGWNEGDVVTADINLSCGSCIYCLQNKPLLCSQMSQIGIHQDGAFAEYVKAPARSLVRLNPETPFQKLALIEPVSCCVRTFRLSGISFSKSVVIVGGGSMGLLLVQMAKLVGAAPVVMVARRQETLDLASEMGADHTILTGPDDIENVKKLTGGYGADYVIEAVGKQETYEKSCAMLGPGGRLAAFGIMEEGQKTPFEFFRTVLQEQSVTGSCAGAGTDFHEAAKLVEYDRFALDRYSSNILPLEKIAEGFDRFMNDKTVLKVIIDMEL
jgi:2-desacetyl-2-hydroxyethyl bacteriochlorophyllide A dehydrogenase